MGEIAAIVTAICWAFSSIFFSSAAKLVGSVVLNRIRLVFAVIILAAAHLILQGQILPLGASWDRWMWLGFSGIAGLVLGDSALFQCYILVGPRIGTLMMALAPVIAAIMAWLFLGETLGWMQIGGILLAVAGICVVILEQGNGNGAQKDRRQYALGILFGLGGAAGQAAGLVLAKRGLEGNFPALSGVMIRMLVAMLVIWAITILFGQARATVKSIRDRRLIQTVAGGTIVGPFIGVWMSLVAVQLTYVGIASTLIALTPIFLLPISKWGYKEQVSRVAVAGTLIALMGVAVIFLTPGTV
ncbi:MAG: DMT family transporter [Chloroflexi bacterium]|nr:DMT family transporter [Chloroflexota bacterium]